MRVAIFVVMAGLIFPFPSLRADDPPKGWEFIGRTQADTIGGSRPGHGSPDSGRGQGGGRRRQRGSPGRDRPRGRTGSQWTPPRPG